ncbi:hypothetical protein GGTG_01689 [Gaeumannomyces tritici R3-111a-1]|uniref:Uncharacterized protein n=1 Tax=Gaeumannomyces tritici (strain R3-111a-1) TaxID=644352 RepID=J3NKA9_GAET3|nr:hypothetical protein GGTG_01689 [Gaeumannomyces tritici R3-111a-1]EJT81713.1 hypothetical protein GGTG_01689 [Gaeumannomyces tritici R3-111a-1]
MLNEIPEQLKLLVRAKSACNLTVLRTRNQCIAEKGNKPPTIFCTVYKRIKIISYNLSDRAFVFSNYLLKRIKKKYFGKLLIGKKKTLFFCLLNYSQAKSKAFSRKAWNQSLRSRRYCQYIRIKSTSF